MLAVAMENQVSLDGLRCFAAAADHLNFRRAAAAVGLSPQAFSARIAQLEEALELALFVRTTRKVTLTPEGNQLQAHTRRILQLVANCSSVARGQSQEAVELCIGTRFELGRSWLSPALQRLAANSPQWRLHLSFGDAPALLQRLLAHEIDCVVSSSRIENMPVVYDSLHDETYLFVGAPALLRKTPFDKPKDAAAHTLLDERRDLPLFRYLQDRAPVRRWPFRGHRYLGTISVIRDWTVEGHGVAVLPEYLVRPDLKAKRLVRILPRMPLQADQFRLLWRMGHPREPLLRQLAEALRGVPLR